MKIIQAKRNIDIPVYGGRIDVVISNEEDVVASCKRNFKVDDNSIKGYDAVCLGANDDSVRIYPVLFCKRVSPGMIAHEAKHLVNKVFIDVGIPLNLRNDEAEAYFLGWIVNRIWEVKIEYDKKLKANESRSRINADKA